MLGLEVRMSNKILVVDDEPDITTYMEMLLNEAGFEVLTAEDGRVALEVAKQEKPELVILDLLMPRNTGTDFYRRMRRDKEIANTPVIVVSALAGRNLAVGKAVAVFDKPIDPDEFMTAVRRVVNG